MGSVAWHFGPIPAGGRGGGGKGGRLGIGPPFEVPFEVVLALLFVCVSCCVCGGRRVQNWEPLKGDMRAVRIAPLTAAGGRGAKVGSTGTISDGLCVGALDVGSRAWL